LWWLYLYLGEKLPAQVTQKGLKMAREQYYKKAWSYDPSTGASGMHLVLDGNGDPILVNGNVAVDYVWGNFPIQPNDDRTVGTTDIGGGDQDRGWSVTHKYSSDVLQQTDYTTRFGNATAGFDLKSKPDSHNMVTAGWAGYPATLKVPNVVGEQGVGAASVGQTAISALGLAVGTVTSVTSWPSGKNTTLVVDDSHPRGTIVAQSPVAGDSAKTLDVVALWVLDTDVTADVVVPVVVGLLQAAAESAITAAGLTVGAVTTADNAAGATALNNGKVKTQTPVSGALANTAATVALVVYAYTP
jgi:hypothetical protein